MAGSGKAADSATSAAQRGLLLVPSGQVVPASLVRAMGRKRLSPTVVTDAPTVLVQLARSPRAIVIATAPAETPGFSSLVRAVERHYPAAALWQLEFAEGRHRLTAVAQPAASQSGGDSEPTPLAACEADGPAALASGNAEPPGASTAQALAGHAAQQPPVDADEPGDSPELADPANSEGPSEGSPRLEPATVSAEELAMLLGRTTPRVADAGPETHSER